MYNEPTYLGEIPLTDETLAHYGVKGMKWRRRKGKVKNTIDKHLINLKGRLKTTKHTRTATQWGSEDNRGYSRSEGRVASITYKDNGERIKTYSNRSNLEAGIEAGRRVAEEEARKRKKK